MRPSSSSIADGVVEGRLERHLLLGHPPADDLQHILVKRHGGPHGDSIASQKVMQCCQRRSLRGGFQSFPLVAKAKVVWRNGPQDDRCARRIPARNTNRGSEGDAPGEPGSHRMCPPPLGGPNLGNPKLTRRLPAPLTALLLSATEPSPSRCTDPPDGDDTNTEHANATTSAPNHNDHDLLLQY